MTSTFFAVGGIVWYLDKVLYAPEDDSGAQQLSLALYALGPTAGWTPGCSVTVALRGDLHADDPALNGTTFDVPPTAIGVNRNHVELVALAARVDHTGRLAWPTNSTRQSGAQDTGASASRALRVRASFLSVSTHWAEGAEHVEAHYHKAIEEQETWRRTARAVGVEQRYLRSVRAVPLLATDERLPPTAPPGAPALNNHYRYQGITYDTHGLARVMHSLLWDNAYCNSGTAGISTFWIRNRYPARVALLQAGYPDGPKQLRFDARTFNVLPPNADSNGKPAVEDNGGARYGALTKECLDDFPGVPHALQPYCERHAYQADRCDIDYWRSRCLDGTFPKDANSSGLCPSLRRGRNPYDRRLYDRAPQRRAAAPPAAAAAAPGAGAGVSLQSPPAQGTGLFLDALGAHESCLVAHWLELAATALLALLTGVPLVAYLVYRLRRMHARRNAAQARRKALVQAARGAPAAAAPHQRQSAAAAIAPPRGSAAQAGRPAEGAAAKAGRHDGRGPRAAPAAQRDAVVTADRRGPSPSTASSSSTGRPGAKAGPAHKDGAPPAVQDPAPSAARPVEAPAATGGASGSQPAQQAKPQGGSRSRSEGSGAGKRGAPGAPGPSTPSDGGAAGSAAPLAGPVVQPPAHAASAAAGAPPPQPGSNPPPRKRPQANRPAAPQPTPAAPPPALPPSVVSARSAAVPGPATAGEGSQRSERMDPPARTGSAQAPTPRHQPAPAHRSPQMPPADPATVLPLHDLHAIATVIVQATPLAKAAAASAGASSSKGVSAVVAGAESDEEDDAVLCLVCHDAPWVYGFMHGDSVHRGVCAPCKDRHYSGPGAVTCPLCRREVEEMLAVCF